MKLSNISGYSVAAENRIKDMQATYAMQATNANFKAAIDKHRHATVSEVGDEVIVF